MGTEDKVLEVLRKAKQLARRAKVAWARLVRQVHGADPFE